MSKPKWKHKKRGTTYNVIGSGHLQTDKPLRDNEIVTIYQDTETGKLWVRPTSEFTDGRFEMIEE